MPNTPRLYQGFVQATSGIFVPNIDGSDHTMQGALHKYVHQKFPVNLLEHVLKNDIPIEMHGLYPPHAQRQFENMGYSNVRHIPFKHNPRKKKYNFIRPGFFLADAPDTHDPRRLLIAVTPGSDYARHYAEMVCFFIATRGLNAQEHFNLIRYPFLEDSIADWSGLDSRFVQKSDRVVLGYVEELEKRLATPPNKGLQKQARLTLIGSAENEYYGSRRYRTLNNDVINFLGAKYSYWGNTSAKIVTRCCALGASEIFYAGKLGSLTQPEDLYNRIFSGASFFNMDGIKITSKVPEIPNQFVIHYGALADSGAHVSVPTILQETLQQRGIAVANSAGSIDNEISQMALAIAQHNESSNGPPVFFSTSHFATDFLHAVSSSYVPDRPNLSVTRQSEVIAMKQMIISRIADYLRDYFQHPLKNTLKSRRKIITPKGYDSKNEPEI